MKLVLDTAVPSPVIVSMAIAGLGLAAADFRRVLNQPRAILAAALGQVVFVPLIGQFFAAAAELWFARAVEVDLTAGASRP